ncbi:sigma-70 family RNA polymerase sigma factor [Aeromonas schubertii]|uniref:RNA polymerase sigma factor n=2 Tax=Aeromonas schubertii TaxID=652 RepID=A0ABS7VDS8_9GAMM|nr:sigma-70 family RNA polymerase sigma factor [Aeromonas schubertii]
MTLFTRWFGKKSGDPPVYGDMADKQTRYEALVKALHGDIYRYAYWLCRDPHVAEDLVQETFLRAWRSLDSLHDEKAAKAWLITIVRRENARRFERISPELVDLDSVALTDPTPAGEREQEGEWLRRQIEKLPEEYREPLVMQVMLGMSGDEIAEQLGINKNTVNTRLFRARNQLREALSQSKEQRGQGNG